MVSGTSINQFKSGVHYENDVTLDSQYCLYLNDE